MVLYRVTAEGERRFVWCYSPSPEAAKQVGARYLDTEMREMSVHEITRIDFEDFMMNEWRNQ